MTVNEIATLEDQLAPYIIRPGKTDSKPPSPFPSQFAYSNMVQDHTSVTFGQVFITNTVRTALNNIVPSLLPSTSPYYRPLHIPGVRGILLYGLPETGKTTIVRAFANSHNLTLVRFTDANIRHGRDGCNDIRKAFQYARLKKSCIIFIDQADSILESRELTHRRLGDLDYLHVFASMIDPGAQKHNSTQPTVIAATNNPLHMDSVLVNRLAVRYYIDLPDLDIRSQVLHRFLEGRIYVDSEDLVAAAEETEGFSVANLEQVAEFTLNGEEEVDDDASTYFGESSPIVPAFPSYLTATNADLEYLQEALWMVRPTRHGRLLERILEFHREYGYAIE